MKGFNLNMERRQELNMAREEPSQVSTVKKERQTISIPFVWEVSPGTPKKDWKPTPAPIKTSAPPPPIKLIASVPFEWEEKPGKPLPYCLQPPPSSPPPLPQAESDSLKSPVQHNSLELFEGEGKPGNPLPCSSQPPPVSSSGVHPKVESNFPSPVKLIASVPFEWEEKPGKPLLFFQSPSRFPLALPQAVCNSSPSFPGLSEGNIGNWISMNNSDGNESEILESDPEICEYETDDGSFTSAPSFSANNLTERMVVVPLGQYPSKDLNSERLQSPGSPTTETESTCSYATGTTSLVGASFLEWLFPLLTPRSSFLDKVGCSEGVSQIQPKKQLTEFHRERNNSAAIRRPQTLGELIMMSRRRSYQRKAIQMQKENFSKVVFHSFKVFSLM